MTSHKTFSSQLCKSSICLAKSDFATQICYTLLMKISLSLQKKMNVRTIFSPYHKHCTVTLYCIAPNFCSRKFSYFHCHYENIILILGTRWVWHQMHKLFRYLKPKSLFSNLQPLRNVLDCDFTKLKACTSCIVRVVVFHSISVCNHLDMWDSLHVSYKPSSMLLLAAMYANIFIQGRAN